MAASTYCSMLQMLIVSRILGPEEFGAFGAMAVVLLIGSTVMAATQVTIARHVASGRSLEQIGARSVLTAGLITFAMAAAVSPLLSNVLNLNDVAGLMLVAATFIPFAITGAQLGCSRATRTIRASVCSTSSRPSRESSLRSSGRRSARPPTPRCSGWRSGRRSAHWWGTSC